MRRFCEQLQMSCVHGRADSKFDLCPRTLGINHHLQAARRCLFTQGRSSTHESSDAGHAAHVRACRIYAYALSTTRPMGCRGAWIRSVLAHRTTLREFLTKDATRPQLKIADWKRTGRGRGRGRRVILVRIWGVRRWTSLVAILRSTGYVPSEASLWRPQHIRSIRDSPAAAWARIEDIAGVRWRARRTARQEKKRSRGPRGPPDGHPASPEAIVSVAREASSGDLARAGPLENTAAAVRVGSAKGNDRWRNGRAGVHRLRGTQRDKMVLMCA